MGAVDSPPGGLYMKAIEIMVALAISLLAIAGISSACDIPAITPGDIQFSEQINRPGNFAYSDTATLTGWNSWSHQSTANAGTMDSTSMFKTLDVAFGCPEEKSHETVQMNFFKNGQTVDPLVGETIDSDITVGAVGTTTVPTFDATGNIPQAAIDERYDIMHYTMGGSAGTPTVTNGALSGIANDGSRQVFSQILSSQDDYIHAQGFDSAGNVYAVPTSYTDVVIPGTPGTSESQAYRQFNWQDTRGWKSDGTDNGVWNINNMVQYQVYPIQFNVGQ